VLEELRIRGLGVIDDAVLTLGPGLTAVTGETGAGKTMVVTGLLLLFGGRAETDRVRAERDQASIDGRVELAPASPLIERVLDTGGALDDGTSLVLRRVVSAAGRSRAYVGGAPAPVAVLAELAESLLVVHGQSDQLRLTRPAEQRAVLDRHAGIELETYSAAFTRWRDVVAALAERTSDLGALRREADALTFGLAEIEAAAPQPGEDVELTELASRLAHADALRLAARSAHDALLGDADDPTGDVADVNALLGRARRDLALCEGDDQRLDGLAERLAELAALTTDIGAELAGYQAELDADPGRLAQIEARRATLNGLIRKYAPAPEEGTAGVLRWAERAQARLREVDVSDEALAALTIERDQAAATVGELAIDLSARRRRAGAELAAAVTAELAGLAMPAAAVTVVVRPRPASAGTPTVTVSGELLALGPDGADEVEIRFRSHPDAPELPIGRGASGGELSRVMLAIEVCLAGSDPVATMVFDEVDAGIGGRAALEVGRRLARLARERQVIVVTHLAQVAAFADRHIVVGRSAEAGVSASDVHIVTGAARKTELARMLAGSDSGTARRHATELLATAAKERPGAA
jgi:DNA repair protein RecN (Recombination protein N)